MNLFEALYSSKETSQAAELTKVYREQQGAHYIKQAAAIAKTAFEVAGQPEDPVCRLYTNLLADPTCTPGKLKLAQAVMVSLGRVTTLEKQAEGWVGKTLGLARNVAGTTAAAAPEAASILALASGAFGSALGGGAWLVNRGLSQEDQKIREIEIQRDTYNRLASEVRDELKRRKLAPTPENQAAAIDYLT